MTCREEKIDTVLSRPQSVPIQDVLDPARDSEDDAANSIHNDQISSPSVPIPCETRLHVRKKPSASTAPGEEGHLRGARRRGKIMERTSQRAAHACLRCRRQKLRCLGGSPCERCTRTSNVCDFGHDAARVLPSTDVTIGPGAGAAINVDAVRDRGRARRLKELDTSIANLLAGLAEEPNLSHQGYPYLEMFNEVIKNRKEPSKSATTLPSTTPSRLPPPIHVRPLNPIRFSTDPVNPVNLVPSADHGRNIALQANTLNTAPNDIPSETAVSLEASLNGPSTSVSDRERGLSNLVTESLHEAPFRSLVHHSKPDSLERISGGRDEPERFCYKARIHREDDDPVNTAIVDQDMAVYLFQFFIDHCHPFLPIVDVKHEDAFVTTRQSASLFSAVIAIAAHFYPRYNARCPPGGGKTGPPLKSYIPARLANLAEAHLSHTLLRRRYALTDVQAILLLAAWDLKSDAASGPDAWVVTGHAARVSRRLGVRQILAQAAESARSNEQGSLGWQKLEAFLPQWRTWLCWFMFDGFLSLGFGRPQSTQFETVDEYGFLQMRLNGPLPRPGSVSSQALYGDVYIAGQVQLAQIGRDLFNWGEMLADTEKAIYADPRRLDIFRGTELSLKTMLSDLNTRLDEWCRLWVWTGSLYGPYLGPFARIARLQAEHLRLSLNSYVLKPGSEQDKIEEGSGPWLRSAFNAAVNTIQIHHESSQTDFELSFATDYLTIALAQAAAFLVRINQAPKNFQLAIKIEEAVISYYLQMSIDLLESSDMSETRIGISLAKTLRANRRAVRTPGVADDGFQKKLPVEARLEDRNHAGMASAPTFELNVPDLPFNNQDISQTQSDLNLSYLLGLTTDDPGAFLLDGVHWSTDNTGDLASYSDLGSAMATAETHDLTQPWNGTIDGLNTVFR